MTAENLLKQLIALPSVNPAFLPADDPNAGEQRVAEFLAASASRAGLDVEFQSVAPRRANVLARLTPPGRIHRRVLLVPHMDTVNAAPDQFHPRVRDGRILGRGACDTKGSVASMLVVLCNLARSGPAPRGTEIVFAGVVDEENAQAGSRHLARSGIRADLAIVGEPTLARVVTAHKGSIWLRLEAKGKAAHGAHPELGRNAVHRMARIVDALETDYARSLRARRHPLLGHATVNVGTICGGSQPNIVPDRCTISVDRRTIPGETETGVRKEIAGFLGRRGMRAGFATEKLAPCLPMETDAKLPLVRALMSAAGQRAPAGVHFFCDAAVLSERGIPSVVFGPGNIAQGHTGGEWISVRSLEQATGSLNRFLRELP